MLAYSISPNELWNAIATPQAPRVIDVRRRDFYESSTDLLPGAVWRDAGKAAHWADEFGAQPVVVVSTELVVLLSVVAARRATDLGRLAGLGLLGIATLTRFFPAIIVPLFLLAFRRTARQLALFLSLLIGLVALVEIAGLVTSGSSTILTILDTYEHFQYWFDAGLYLRFDDWIFLFPVLYLL